MPTPSTTWRVHAGPPLSGRTRVGGSKNAALPLLAAAACLDRPVTVHDVPTSADVATLVNLLHQCGATTVGATTGAVTIDRPDRALARRAHDQAGTIRASYYLVAPLLATLGRADLPWPGGCRIGARGMEWHFEVYKKFGDRVTESAHGYTVTRAGGSGPVRIDLPFPSRGATLAAALRAVCDHRRVTIEGPNLVPETRTVLEALAACDVGVDIRGNTLTVDATGPHRTARWRVPADKIEAFTVLCALAVTGGAGTVTNTDPAHLAGALNRLRDLGLDPHACEDRISLDASCRGPGRAVEAIADLHPEGLDADTEPALLVTALSTATAGPHLFGDDINPGRHANLIDQLRRFGARIQAHSPTRCTLTGPQSLHAARARATDIRTGTALVLAALSVPGTSVIEHAEQIQRGHPDLSGVLGGLGAKIEEEVQ